MSSGRRVEPLIPQRVLPPKKAYVRKPGAGRPPKPARQVFEGIVYVLRTGCQWKALPGERFGSASAIHKRFLEWEKAGFFEAANGRPDLPQLVQPIPQALVLYEKLERSFVALNHLAAFIAFPKVPFVNITYG
jgi:transposase